MPRKRPAPGAKPRKASPATAGKRPAPRPLEEGRAPWPSFAKEARALLGPRLAPLGLYVEESPRDRPGRLLNGGTHASFSGPGGRVALVYDPWDVDLEVTVDGLWLGQLLELARPGAVEPAPSKRGLAELAELLAALLPKLSQPDGARAAAAAAKWQAVLRGDSAAALLDALARGPAPAIRAAAARSLGWQEPATASAGRGLAQALGDPSLEVRRAAAEALYHRASSAPATAARALARSLGDPDGALRAAALLALRQLGRRAAAARGAIEERAKSGGAREQRLAEEALAALDR